jgi:hypothetical protein
MARRPPHVCGVMDKGDVCGLPAYHQGPHTGSHTGVRWSVKPSEASPKGREERSRAGSVREEERERRERTRPNPPHVPPRPDPPGHWFFRARDRAPRRQETE